jgi:5-methylcytosine-specific restriction protein A
MARDHWWRVVTERAAWEHSTRRRRLPPDWPKRREQTKKRAGGQCEHMQHGVRCVLPGNECDHIVAGDNHSLENLQWLCAPHHREKTQREARAAQVSEKRPRERHPGLR